MIKLCWIFGEEGVKWVGHVQNCAHWQALVLKITATRVSIVCFTVACHVYHNCFNYYSMLYTYIVKPS
jgi:hypothetical protein